MVQLSGYQNYSQSKFKLDLQFLKSCYNIKLHSEELVNVDSFLDIFLVHQNDQTNN